MMEQKEKIRSLFYTTNAENRALAFELAKGANCHEEMIEEFYTLLSEIPRFEKEKKYFQEDLEADGLAMPEGLAFKEAYVEYFASYFFYEEIDFNCRYDYANKAIKLTAIPQVVFNLDFATSLNLGWNDLEFVPEEIAQLRNLKVLDLSCNNRLKGLPDSLAELTQLEKLVLYGNGGIFSKRKFVHENPDYDEYINELPLCLQQLKNLKHLDLGDIYIDGLPEWISELRNLESIYIFSGFGSHPYFSLPKTLTDLPNLKTLQINAYTVDIPADIDKMQSLECLIIEPARSIPSSIKNLKKLTYLDFSYFSSDYPIEYEGYDRLWDLYDKGVPEGVSRLQLYRWEWLKEMTWLEEFVFKHIEPYAFTEKEKNELEKALPNCTFILEEA